MFRRSLHSRRGPQASETANSADAVLFFLGREAGLVTGQTIYVCGGLTAGVAAVRGVVTQPADASRRLPDPRLRGIFRIVNLDG